MEKIVLITGASSGIGKATALLLAQSGYAVFAAVRNEADALALRREALAGLTPILLDVTNPEHVKQAYTQIAEVAGNDGVMAVINNAGINYTIATEEADIAQARTVFDVHFWGMVYLVKQFLPLLRHYAQQHPNQARIINVSSVGGISAFPFIQFYNAAKFAIMGFTESLRFELNHFGIKAIAILPGSVKTEIFRKANDSAQQALAQENSVYRAYLQKATDFSKSHANSGVSAAKAALVLKKALEDRKPPLKYFIGTDAKMLHLLVKFLPDSWRHWLFRQQFGF